MTITLLLLLLTAAAAGAQSPEPATPAITAFEQATREYALMHRRLEAQIGSIEFRTPVAEINRIIQELASSIRAERRGAMQGEFFTPAVAPALRARIGAALIEHQFTPDDVVAASQVDGVDYRHVRLAVNDTFPWVLAVAMFPCVIEALPPLPPELQYRMVADDLVLIDIHASLVVDILPHALPELTWR